MLGGTHPTLRGRQCKHPPAELGALGCEPPKALSTGLISGTAPPAASSFLGSRTIPQTNEEGSAACRR